MELQAAIQSTLDKRDLSKNDMHQVMRSIMTGAATSAQIAGFLIGLRCKGETVDEITSAAEIMRELASKIDIQVEHLIDTCGTGGDSLSTFNISTATAFVVAAAGGKVAKHGNRSVSSSSGSADVLEAAGVNLNLTPQQVKQCIESVGVGFLFAPKHHSAMKHAITPRREMGVRTLFNLLGPLSNPALAPNQLIGVFDQAWVRPLAEVSKKLGSQHVLIVHAEDGLDEISIAAPTSVAELKDGKIITYQLTPDQFGLQTTSLEPLVVKNATESLQMIHQVLKGEPGASRDIVLMNAGAAIYAAGLADDIAEGIAHAQAAIDSGAAHEKLNTLIALSHSFS